MDVDLLRMQGKWRETLMTMRCRLADVASSGGYPTDHMTPWRAHLDRQLYKALEVQYRLGLESLNERMPEMRLELVYQQSQLTLQPPFEEVSCAHSDCCSLNSLSYSSLSQLILLPRFVQFISCS